MIMGKKMETTVVYCPGCRCHLPSLFVSRDMLFHEIFRSVLVSECFILGPSRSVPIAGGICRKTKLKLGWEQAFECKGWEFD